VPVPLHLHAVRSAPEKPLRHQHRKHGRIEVLGHRAASPERQPGPPLFHVATRRTVVAQPRSSARPSGPQGQAKGEWPGRRRPSGWAVVTGGH